MRRYFVVFSLLGQCTLFSALLTYFFLQQMDGVIHISESSYFVLITVFLAVSTFSTFLFFRHFILKKNVEMPLFALMQKDQPARLDDNLNYIPIDKGLWSELSKRLSSVNGSISTLQSIKARDFEKAEKHSSLIQDKDLHQSITSVISDLREIMTKEEITYWYNEGISKFSELLSRSDLPLNDFCEYVINALVKYVQCNQGVMYIKDIETEEYLLPIAAYACQMEILKEQRIEKGVLLVGQCWMDGKLIYIDNAPKDYVKITSGLGTASPNVILLVPLVYNSEVEGVIEITSFNKIAEREIKLIEKVAELIAAQIQSRASGERIKALLRQSEEKTHQLLSQEEELRQNTEEITAQREDLERKVNIQKLSIEKLQNSEDSVIINVAGRQRMLSQQMAFYSTMLYHGKVEVKEKLQKTIELFDHSLVTLRNGGIFMGVGYNKVINPTSGVNGNNLEEIEKIWKPIHSCIKVLLETDFSLPRISVSKEKTFKEIRYVEDNISVLLEANHVLTQAYMEESFRWRKKIFDDMEVLFADSLVGKFN